MFRFEHPEYLYALYLIPVLIGAYFFIVKSRKKTLNKFANKNLHNVLLPAYSGIKDALKYGLLVLTIALLILAAANPQIGTKMEKVKQTGIDVFICLDVSLSMQAQDIKPSRLEKAKYQISNLIRNLHGDRIGLIIFAGAAYIQFPLTTDYSAANLFLSAVDVNSVPQPGTAIGSAITLATKSFDYSSKSDKAIIIITDGENHEGNIMEAVGNAVSKGIKIYTIGLGSPEGVPIPIYNQQGEQIGFKKDNERNTVLTKLDEGILIKIADASGGKYFRGNNFDDNLDKIYKDLSSLKKAEFGVKKITDYESRYYYFLIPAILLLIIEFFITQRKSPFFVRLNKRLGLD